MTVSGLLQKGRVPPSVVGHLPFHCTTCGACEEACLHGNQVPFWLLQTRRRLFSHHRIPTSVAEAAAYFGVAGNRFGFLLEPQLRAALSETEFRLSRTADDVYLAGCETLTSQPSVVTSLFRALARLEIRHLKPTSASSLCCGAPLAWAGEHHGFTSHAGRLAGLLEGARRLIVHDPACAHTLRILYPRFGIELRPEVWTLPGFLARAFGAAASTSYAGAKLRRRVVLEPCHLAQAMGEKDRPRALLGHLFGDDWGLLTNNGMSDCCGAGGLLPQSAPQTALALAKLKISAFRDSGAQTLVSLSPRCGAHLRQVEPDLPVRDLAEVVLEDNK